MTSQKPRAPDSLEPFLLPQKVSSSQDLEEGMGAGGMRADPIPESSHYLFKEC